MKLLLAAFAVVQGAAVCLAGQPGTGENSTSSMPPAALEPGAGGRLSLAWPTLEMAPPGSPTGAPNRDHDRLTLSLADVGPATAPAPSRGGGSDAEALAKKLANPIANLISVPFQYNADFNAGVSGRAHRSYLNIQPVIPLDLNEEWNVITRTIIPIIYQEQYAPGQSTNTGLGDITASFFFSPKAPTNGWIWGVGPVAYLPTATDTALGAGQWGAGPTAVALRQDKGFTYGVLTNHIWSFCGDGDRPEVNVTLLQPFISYTWPTATTISLNTESTFDWSRSQWTVPVNLWVSQIVKVGRQPVQFQLGGRYYAEGPSEAPEWGMRFAVVFLFPK